MGRHYDASTSRFKWLNGVGIKEGSDVQMTDAAAATTSAPPAHGPSRGGAFGFRRV